VVGRARHGVSGRPSRLHPGHTGWDVAGTGTARDLRHLHLPPVLPGAGGYFDADLEIMFNGGVDGEWQIPMADCTVG